MEALLQFIEAYGLWVVFVCVLLDQGGLPTPAYPPIIVTAALAVDLGECGLESLLAVCGSGHVLTLGSMVGRNQCCDADDATAGYRQVLRAPCRLWTV